MSTPDIPLLDISRWREGSQRQREDLAARMDRALQDSGFLMIENHGVPAALRDRIRAQARTFFALPHDRKARYATPVAGRGWIPQGGEAGPAREGQFRVAPHTDWGILTILDRQPGYGGLQIQTPAGTWADAPYVEDAFTVNVADLLSRWTGERWRSTRHRVLPPPRNAPDEELISLIVFLEAEVDTVIRPVAGNNDLEPVVAGEWLRAREAAATVAQPAAETAG